MFLFILIYLNKNLKCFAIDTFYILSIQSAYAPIITNEIKRRMNREKKTTAEHWTTTTIDPVDLR